MAPAGGYKGVGAALMVEVFAACLTPKPIRATRGEPVLLETAGGPPGT